MLQDVETDAAVGVNIGVEHFGYKFDFGSFVRVLLCEFYRQVKATTLPNGVLRSKDDGLPVEK